MQLAFIILQFAGQLISFVMGLTMANIIDPSSGIQTPLISHFLTITATTLFLAINGHHYALMLIANSLQNTPFGEFFYIQGVGEYLIKETSNFFKLGFSLAFPILSISILSDVIFGMIMKSMPQFNMLVIGFPIKIGLSIAVIIAILSSLMFMFKRELFDIFKTLSTII
jgi:flagellar biosynthetic protein FliR